MKSRDHAKVGLTIRYKAGFLFPAPDLTVAILDTECQISDREQISLGIERGEYDIRFSSGGSETVYHAVIEGDTVLSIGRNRRIGGIKVRDVSGKYCRR